MSVSFQELSGSPKEVYTTDGFTATRQFLVRWCDRERFACWLLGTSAEYNNRDSVGYPNRADVCPYQLKIEPYNPESIKLQSITQPCDGVNDYGSYALVTVSYRTLTVQDLESGPNAETGTRLTYRMTYVTEPMQLYPTGTFWQNNSQSLSSSENVIKIVPHAIHVLTWQQVLFPPWTAIHELQGRVNSGTFLDCPAETLLYEGVTVNKLYRGDLGEGASSFCWSLEYHFRQRIIYHGSTAYGWNVHFQPSTGTWQNIRLGKPPAIGSPLYESGDFNRLFVSEYPAS